MTKHVSSGGEATSSSRDAATESLPIRESADASDAAAQHLPQGAVGALGSDGNTAGNTDGSTDGSTDVKDLKAAAGSADSGAVRTEALAKDVTPDSAKGSGAAHSAAGSSTADTRLGGAWASPDAQNAATIGVVPSTSAAAKKARTKARGPWYRRRAVVGAAGVALLAGSFGAGWGTNELLSSHSQHGQAQQQGAGNGQGMPGGGQGGPGGGGPGGHGGPGGQMPGGGPGGQGGQGGPGGQNGQNGQGGPGGGSGGAGRTTPNGDASSGSGSSGGQQSGSGSGDGKQKGGSGSSGVLQQQDASPSTQS
ncbi:hypothetical protein [Actinomyces oris]